MPDDAGIGVRAFVEQIMGIPVSVHIRAHRPGRDVIATAVAAVFARLSRAEAIFSTWQPTSELMRLRRGDLALADADPSMRVVMDLCERAASVTGGLFTTDLVAPDGTRGWDPTGLVKGWAVDDAAAVLRTVDRIAFSINAGGDIVCGLGRLSDALANTWNIGIEDPADRSRISRVLPITVGAIATSSAAARGAHIIDPRTGAGLTHPGSATVTGPELVWADVWATTTFIDPTALGRSDGFADYRLWTIDLPRPASDTRRSLRCRGSAPSSAS
ncbi:FAD:protein FMN transferase [Rhodococcoides yunnanense]|uniref:FAD:protein FMN transferase n=1 Tax=Rhodococcoides yunnanense TaxID=278209 RepID=UPI0009342898|nr:FAD:protein FMN transferase [Rhodococcus yunnanensis]